MLELHAYHQIQNHCVYPDCDAIPNISVIGKWSISISNCWSTNANYANTQHSLAHSLTHTHTHSLSLSHWCLSLFMLYWQMIITTTLLGRLLIIRPSFYTSWRMNLWSNPLIWMHIYLMCFISWIRQPKLSLSCKIMEEWICNCHWSMDLEAHYVF